MIARKVSILSLLPTPVPSKTKPACKNSREIIRVVFKLQEMRGILSRWYRIMELQMYEHRFRELRISNWGLNWIDLNQTILTWKTLTPLQQVKSQKPVRFRTSSSLKLRGIWRKCPWQIKPCHFILGAVTLLNKTTKSLILRCKTYPKKILLEFPWPHLQNQKYLKTCRNWKSFLR